jgi:mannose-6-phosphate isomerase-like protein (cupin superfamily)
MKSSVFSLEKKWQDSINKPIEVLMIKDTIEIGILTVQPNTRLPPEGFSIHQNSHEFGYVIEGEIIIGIDEGEKIIKEGELLYNKPGTPHYTLNKSPKPAKILWFVTPPLS